MNTLTNLIPSLYSGLDIVSRELVGFIPAVTRDATTDRAAVGQDVRVHVAPAANVSNIAPAMSIPEPTDQTIGNKTITITKSRAAEFGFVGEEALGLNNNGAGFNAVQADMFAQAVRALVNEVESDLAGVAYKGASRAYGTAGTTPFASDTKDSAQIRKILDDNGAPLSDRSLVLSTSAGANMRTLLGINANRPSEDTMTMRQGSLIDLHGMVISESGQAKTHTKGNGSAYTSNTAGYAVGATVITLITGTGTVLAGDVVTFAGDPNKYVVAVGVSAPGAITLAAPGLRQALPASAVALTVGNTYEAGVAFSRNAIVLAARAPALPDGGDVATDRFMMVDPRSGLPLEVSVYKGYRKQRFEVALAWGFSTSLKPEHTALLLG